MKNNEGSKEETLSSLPQASFNYINSIVGSGVIGIPYALHRAGFGLGLFLLVIVAVITDYSLILMVRCGHLSGRFSYPGVMEAAYGKAGYYLLSLLQFMYPFLGDLLENYCWDDDLMNFARVLFSISILLTFPIECFVSREIVRTQIKRFYSQEVVEYDTDKDPSHATGAGEEDDKSVATTLVIVLAAFIISPYTECLGPVLELNGLLAAIPLAYVLPGLAYIQLSPHSLFSQEKLPAAGLVLFGTFVTISGAALLVPNLIGDCRTGIIMGYCRDDELAVNGTMAGTTPSTDCTSDGV